MASASLCISTSKFGIVTLAIISAFGILLSGPAMAEDDLVAVPGSGEIEAKAYDIKVVRPSKSGRVYLFEKFDADLPVDGKLFLVREGETPIMAMRVLRTYVAKNRIAAKKLRAYPGYETLARGAQFRAFEKTGDMVAPIPPSAEDLKDLQELESPENYDPEGIELHEKENGYDEIEHYFPNQFTMAVGMISNVRVPGPNPKFGGGLLYARNFSPTMALEGGMSYYQASGQDPVNLDTVTMTVVPFSGTIRMQKKYGELWTAYIYGGFSYPFVSAQIGATNRLLREVQVISPALGVGAFLQTGPNWYLRVNLGIDTMTLGVMLRY